MYYCICNFSGDPVVVSGDEEYKKVNFDKVKALKAVFKKDGKQRFFNISFNLNQMLCCEHLLEAIECHNIGICWEKKKLAFEILLDV